MISYFKHCHMIHYLLHMINQSAGFMPIMSRMKILLFTILLESAFGAWIFEVEIQNITVLHEVAYDEDEQMYCCCDACQSNIDVCCFSDPMSSNCTNIGAGACDCIITVCLDYNGDTEQQCVRSNDIFRNGDMLALFSSLSSGQTIYNRLYFSGNQYPSNGSIGLNIIVDERDGIRLTPMDSFLLQWNFTTSTDIGAPQIYTSRQGVVQLSIANRLYCADDYFGSNCEIYCNNSLQSAAVCSPESTQVATESQSVDTGCLEWRVTTIALIVFLAFCFGICCTSALLLVVLRKRKAKNHQRSAHDSHQFEPPHFSNPMYAGKQLKGSETQKDKELEAYISMSSCPDGTMSTLDVTTKYTNSETNFKDGDQYYEIMPNQATMGMRTNFAKLATPGPSNSKSDFTHTYETVDEKQDSNKNNDS